MVSISIIIPIYNVEAFIRRCLDSVMSQAYSDATVECILIDDCTPDGSVAIVEEMLNSYDGPISFVLLKHEDNRGLSAARNTGISHAKGDYVFFMDSDDYLLPDSLDYFLNNIKQYPYADIVMGNVQTCKSGDLLIHKINEPWFIDDPDVFFRRLLHHQIYLYAWNKMIKRELLMSNNILFEEGILFEDQCWSYQLFSQISSVLLLPRVTYVYEYNLNSIVNTTQTAEKAEKVIWSYTISINKMLENPPDLTKYKSNLIVDYLLFMVNFLMNGVDILSKFAISDKIKRDFLGVRLKLLSRSLHFRRFLLFLFFLILFPPLSHLQKLRMFRHHYYDLESMINSIAHLTDFLHCK